jgi:hypothetical protein
VIVENIEGDPELLAAPPAPTVIGKDVPPVNEIFVPPGKEVR